MVECDCTVKVLDGIVTAIGVGESIPCKRHEMVRLLSTVVLGEPQQLIGVDVAPAQLSDIRGPPGMIPRKGLDCVADRFRLLVTSQVAKLNWQPSSKQCGVFHGILKNRSAT